MPVFICFQSKYVQLLARQKAAAQRRRDARSKLMKRYGCYMPCWYCSICHVAHRSNCTTTCSDHCGGGGSYEPPFFIYFWGVLLTCVLLTLPLSSLPITAHHCPSLPITAVNALHFLRYANDEAQMNDIVRRYVQAKRKGDVNAEHQRLMDQIETTTMLAASQGVNAGLIKQKAEQGMVSRFFVCFGFFALFIDLLTDKVQPLSRTVRWCGRCPNTPPWPRVGTTASTTSVRSSTKWNRWWRNSWWGCLVFRKRNNTPIV